MGRYRTIKTGFQTVDSAVKGWHPGELSLVGGLPRMGKTAFVLSVAANLVKKDVPVALFSATDTIHPAFLNRVVKTSSVFDFEGKNSNKSSDEELDLHSKELMDFFKQMDYRNLADIEPF